MQFTNAYTVAIGSCLTLPWIYVYAYTVAIGSCLTLPWIYVYVLVIVVTIMLQLRRQNNGRRVTSTFVHVCSVEADGESRILVILVQDLHLQRHNVATLRVATVTCLHTQLVVLPHLKVHFPYHRDDTSGAADGEDTCRREAAAVSYTCYLLLRRLLHMLSVTTSSATHVVCYYVVCYTCYLLLRRLLHMLSVTTSSATHVVCYICYLLLRHLLHMLSATHVVCYTCRLLQFLGYCIASLFHRHLFSCILEFPMSEEIFSKKFGDQCTAQKCFLETCFC